MFSEKKTIFRYICIVTDQKKIKKSKWKNKNVKKPFIHSLSQICVAAMLLSFQILI